MLKEMIQWNFATDYSHNITTLMNIGIHNEDNTYYNRQDKSWHDFVICLQWKPKWKRQPCPTLNTNAIHFQEVTLKELKYITKKRNNFITRRFPQGTKDN